MANGSDKSAQVVLRAPLWAVIVGLISVMAAVAYGAFELTKFGFNLQKNSTEISMKHTEDTVGGLEKKVLAEFSLQKEREESRNKAAMSFMEEFRAERLASSSRFDEISKVAYTTSAFLESHLASHDSGKSETSSYEGGELSEMNVSENGEDRLKFVRQPLP